MIDIIGAALDLPPAPTLTDHPLPAAPPERYRRRGLTLRPAPPDQDDWIDLDQLEPMLMTAIREYMADPEPDHALLLAAPAGGGKTTIAVRLAEQVAAAGRRVLYCGPRRDFWQDIQALAARPDWWYQWLPRQLGDPDAGQPTTCRHADAMSAWHARGYQAIDLCSNGRICGWNYVRDHCPYHRQKAQPRPIVYGSHQHAALGHPLMREFGLLIGDESPLQAFLHPWHIPSLSVLPPDVDDTDLELLLRALRALCATPCPSATCWQGGDLYTALGGAQHVVEVLEAADLPVDQRLVLAPELRSAVGADSAPWGHLLTLCALLLREARRLEQGLEIIPRVRVDVTGLTLLLRRAPPALPAHTVWLDATGSAGMYQTLLGRPVRQVRPRVRPRGRIYQLWASANGRGAMTDQRTDVQGEARGAVKQATIKAQISRIVEWGGYQQPAVISYKPLGGSLLPGAPYSHFGGARGTNRLQDCDALVVVGAPMPAPPAIKDIAAMLYQERDEPWCDAWYPLDRPFAGQAAAYSVGGYWDDPDLQQVVQELRESEIVQAIHRARPLRRSVDVWLLTNVVTDQPVELVSLHDLFGAVDRDGRALVGVDVLRWPEVMALAATDDEPLTSARLMQVFGLARSSAVRWYEALKATGEYHEITIQTGGRGRPARGLVKRFTLPN